MSTFDFNTQLSASKDSSVERAVVDALRGRFPTARSIHRAHDNDDRRGADFILLMPGARTHTVDVKVREKDYARLGRPDVALEVWSNVETEKVGWTRDREKLTDWVFWYWKDSGRTLLIPFPPLVSVFENNWRKWVEKYGTNFQTTSGSRAYRSQCLFMSSVDLVAAINIHAGLSAAQARQAAPEAPQSNFAGE